MKASFAIIAMACIAAAGCAQTQRHAYLTPIGDVRLPGVEGRIDHMAADPASGRLFVAALENHSIEVIDLKQMQRVGGIAGVLEPQGLLFVPRFNRLIAASRGDGTCRSFDASTFAEGPWIDLGRNADNVRFDERAQTVLVGSGAEPGPGLLSAIEIKSLIPVSAGGVAGEPRSKADLLRDRPRQADVKSEVKLPSHPESFQVDSDAGRIYVNVPDDHQIAVIEWRDDGLLVGKTWPVTAAEKNFAMALDRGGSRLFVACRKPACLLVYDTRDGRMIGNAPCAGDIDDLFYDTLRQRVYAIGGEGFIDVFDVAAGNGKVNRDARISTAPRARTGLFIPAMDLLVVAAPHIADQPAKIMVYRVER